MKVGGVCFYCVKKLWQLCAALIVFIAVVISILKYTLPYVDSYRIDIQDWVRQSYNADVQIGSISAGWDGTGPAVILQNLSLTPTAAAPLDLVIKETRIKLDFWRSLSEWQLTSDYFVLDGAVAVIDAKSLIRASEGPEDAPFVDALSTLFLSHLKQFSVVDSEVKLNMSGSASQQLSIDQITWFNDNERHQAVGRFKVGEFAANSLSFVLDLTGTRRKNLGGQLFVEATELDISPWLHQFVAADTKVEYSNINFRAWADIDSGVFQQAQIDLGDNQIQWLKKQTTEQLNFGQGQMLWKPSLAGWEVSSNDIHFVFGDTQWPSIHFNLKKQGSLFDFYFSQWSVGESLKLLSLVDLDPQMSQALKDYRPQGLVHDLYVQYQNPQDWRLTGLFADFGWANVGDIPGASNLSGHFGMNSEAGWLKVEGVDGTLATGQLFPQPIEYENLDASLAFVKSHDGHWQIYGDDIWLHNQDLDLVAQLSLSLEPTPTIDFYAEVSGSDLRKADKYYPPEYMGQDVIDYLVGAVKGGKLDMAQMVWSGKLDTFPYADNDGIFLIKTLVSEVNFLFEPGWPVLSNVTGELIFRNDSLTIVPKDGHFLDIDISDKAVATIPSLSEGLWLALDINAKVQPQKVAKLFNASPLRDIFNPVFEQVQVHKPVLASASIRIPLVEEGFDDNLDYQGVVHFADNVIDINTPGLSLDEVSGIFRFDKDRIWTEVFNAKWFGQPVKASLNGMQEQDDYVLALNAQLNVDAKALLQATNDPFEPYISGPVPVDVAVDLRFPPQGVRFEVLAKADVKGAKFDLPAPYDKAVGENGEVVVNIKGDEISSLFTANYDDRLYFNGILPNETSMFSQAHLIVGNKDLGLAGEGFKISVDIDQAQVMPWYEFVFHLVDSFAEVKSEPLLPTPQLISGKVGALSGFGQTFHDVSFDLTEAGGSWDLDLTAKETHSVVHIDQDWFGKGIDIRADYLKLTSSEDDEVDTTINSKALIAKLPPINFSCADCRYDDYHLGKVDIRTQTNDSTLAVTTFNIDKGRHQFNGSGQWVGDNANGVSNFAGRLTSDNIGGLLDEYELTATVKDSDAQIDILANWAGGLHQFNLPSLSGEVKWQLGEGHLTEISDRGSRLLSLLSLDSIVRKLRLDFRDVFSKGFFYNSMKGSMLIESGVAYTDNTEIDGVPGTLNVQGNVNLVNRELDYQAVFYPKVTSSLPVIIGWMVNPISGIAALALDKMLESTKVIAAVHFTITGNISEPVVTEVERQSKDIQLPKTAVKPQAYPTTTDKFAEPVIDPRGDVLVPPVEPAKDPPAESEPKKSSVSDNKDIEPILEPPQQGVP